ncbi:MAG: HmuY family protein [Bacteroidia bacterium]|nr:HmuY family protein [Bacteroidia bacterium]
MILSAIAFCSCTREEKPFTLPPAGSTLSESLTLGENYDSVIYFRLSDAHIETYALNTWDIAFENTVTGYGIYINGGNEIQVGNSRQTSWELPVDAGSIKWKWDNPNGDRDSSAFGKWQDSTEGIYIIDLGIKAAERYIKFRIITNTENSYTFMYAPISSGNPETVTINKSGNKGLLYYSFAKKSTVSCSPERNGWDIILTRYRHIYYNLNPITPYYVVGGLSNRDQGISIAKISNKPFESISKDDAFTATYSSSANTIGFEWKYFNLTQSKYVINSNITYLIKDASGDIYKLHFTDFYNIKGVKGSPCFDYQKL